jgi:hypothetical protein
MLSLHFNSQLKNCLIVITCYSFMIVEIKLQLLYLLLKFFKLKLNSQRKCFLREIWPLSNDLQITI